MTLHLNDITATTPSLETLAAAHREIGTLLDTGKLTEALDAWDTHRRRYQTWAALAGLRFQQDTTDAAAKEIERA